MMAFREGEGRCIATTLRMAGGMGKTAAGIHRNSFAVYLMDRMLKELCGWNGGKGSA